MMYYLVTAQSGEKLLNATNLVYIYQRLKIFHKDRCDIIIVALTFHYFAEQAMRSVGCECVYVSHRAGNMVPHSDSYMKVCKTLNYISQSLASNRQQKWQRWQWLWWFHHTSSSTKLRNTMLKQSINQ